MNTYISPKTKFTLRYWDMFFRPNQPFTWSEVYGRRFLIRIKDQYLNSKVIYDEQDLWHPAHHYLVPTMDVDVAIDLS